MDWANGKVVNLVKGLSRIFTNAVLFCPTLSVTFSWNRIRVFDVTLGATNCHTGVFTPPKEVLEPVGTCIHEYAKIIPLGDLLFDPFRVTIDPAVTV